MTIVVALLAIVVALLVVLVAGLLRTNAEILQRLDAIGEGIGDDSPPADRGSRRADPEPGKRQRTGRPATDLVGATLDGGQQAVRVIDVEHDTLLLFLSSGCLTCRAFFDALRDPQQMTLPNRIRTVVVAKDLDAESPSDLAELLPPRDVPMLLSGQAWVDFEVPGSPYAVLVDGPSGRIIGEGTGGSWEQVANLMAQASGDLAFVGGADRARKSPRDAQAERDSDEELLRAGILPGDESLYPGGRDVDDGRAGQPPA